MTEKAPGASFGKTRYGAWENVDLRTFSFSLLTVFFNLSSLQQRTDMNQRRRPSSASAFQSQGMNSDALVRTQQQRQQRQSASFITLIKNWKPRTTPKLTFSLGLYVVGIFLAFFARPFPVTQEQFEEYEKKLRLIDSPEGGLGEARLNAEDAYRSTRTELYETKRFGWRLRGGSEKSKVLELQRKEKEQWRALKALNKERERKLRDARSVLGIWSEEGVRETKKKFWEKYEGGKVFATQQTFYDAFNALLYGRSDDNELEFMIRWTFTILVNFTVGMFGAIIGFTFSLPSVIYGFGASSFSFISFFILAVISAISVVLTLLGVLYGGAIGGIVGAVNVATNNALRLEEKKREEIKRLQQRQQGRQQGSNGSENFSNFEYDNRDHMD